MSKTKSSPIYWRTFCAVLWASVGFSCGHATAAVIYQNYDGVTPGGGFQFVYLQENIPPTPDLGHRAGVRFTTDSFSYALDSVTVNMQLVSGSVEVRLYSNSGLEPGTSLGLLGSPGGIGAQDNYVFTGGGLILDPNTTYWVVMEPAATPPVSALWYQGTSPGDFATSDYSDGWGPWFGTDNGAAPSTYILATPVPEPAYYGLMAAVGLVIITTIESLRRKTLVRNSLHFC